MALKQRPDESAEDYAARVAFKKKTDNERSRAYALAHRDEMREYRRRHYLENREKYLKNARDYALAHPEKTAAYMRQRKQRMIALPEGHDGACEVCGIVPPLKKNGTRAICQDHRHDTGAIRGYICYRCNRDAVVLDMAYTDPERFARLKAYVMRHAPVEPMPATQKHKRRKAEPHPTLFGEPEES